MIVAVINEISAADRNSDLLEALDGRGLEVLNLGHTHSSETPPLSYIHTGLMSALLLHLKAADMVVAGCGTGIGFLNSVLQYPGVVCGHLLSPLDAFLFARINAGNCVSLALNQGYGWAGGENLRMIFNELFTEQKGAGYPPHRAEPQRQSRAVLGEVSQAAHRPFSEILARIPPEITRLALNHAAFKPVLLKAVEADPGLKNTILSLI